MPTTILASRYNALRNSVNLVLGESFSGAPSYGYGQSLSTTTKIGDFATNPATVDTISALDYEELYIDLIRARSHQVGAAVTIDEFVIGDYDTNTVDTDKVEEAYIIGLESLAANIETDRLLVDPNNLQLTAIPSASSTRLNTQGTWNGTISHIFTMTFANETAKRHFFNAGGQIRLSASVDYSGSDAKAIDWQTILNSMGSTSFKYSETINNAGIGSGSNIGYVDLTSSYQLIYSRTSSAVYANNEYRIYAANQGTSTIIFKVEFTDGPELSPTEYSTDEPVQGTFNSNVQVATPSSSVNINGTVYDAVDLPDPTGAVTRTLS